MAPTPDILPRLRVALDDDPRGYWQTEPVQLLLWHCESYPQGFPAAPE
jgi:hypothetical protein